MTPVGLDTVLLGTWPAAAAGRSAGRAAAYSWPCTRRTGYSTLICPLEGDAEVVLLLHEGSGWQTWNCCCCCCRQSSDFHLVYIVVKDIWNST